MNPERYNFSSHEAPGDQSETASDKKESKKKKKSSPAETTAAESKKEQVAERTKGLLDKLVRPEASKETPTETPKTEAKPEIAEAEKNPESEVDTLSPAEEAEVVAAYAPARIAELKAGRTETEDPADAAAREADIALLESLLAEDHAEEPAETIEPVRPEDGPDLEMVDTTDMPLAESAGDMPEETREFGDEEDIPLQTPGSTGSATRPVPPPAASSAGAGRGGRGPGSPAGIKGASGVPPQGPGGMPGAYGPGFGPGYGPAGPNLNPNLAATSASRPGEYVPDYQQNPNATYLLVGGIVGYFIGRRRGRIRTEKRMKSVQRKLEKQVEAIQHRVVQQEVEAQKLARERYWEQKRQKQPAPAERASPEGPHPIAPLRAERSVSPVDGKTIEQRQPAERPGSERVPAGARERLGVERPQVQELTKAQLLESGEKIKVGNTNLKRIFEAKLITESGLKRLVHEHLEHQDIRRGLAREFMAKELSFERDPLFRDQMPVEASSLHASSAASQSVSAAALAASLPGAPTDHKASSPGKAFARKDKRATKQQVSQGLLIALTLLALGLAVYAVLLGMRH